MSTTAPARRPRRRTRRGVSIDQLPSGRWRVRWTDETNTRRSRSFDGFERADDFAASVKVDQLRGDWRDPDAGAQTLAEYAARWLETAELRDSTRAHYSRVLRLYVTAELDFRPPTGGRSRTVHLGARHLNRITPEDVREWHAAVRATAAATARAQAAQRQASTQASRDRAARAWALREGRPVHTSGRLPGWLRAEWEAAGRPTLVGTYSEDTRDAHRSPGATAARHAYQLLHAVLSAAETDRRILTNPCRIRGAGQPRTAERYLPTAEQVHALAETMPARLRAAVLLAAYGGLRSGELFALARRHVNLTAGTVRVERTLTGRGDRPTLGPPKTDAGRRTISLPPFVLTALRDHLREHVGRSGDDLLFPTTTGAAMPSSRRSEHIGKARAVVGCQEVGWHNLRHYAATSAARMGATTRELQHRIGHSTAAAAMQYQHATPERDRLIAERLEQLHPAIAASASVTSLAAAPSTRHHHQRTSA